jgi:hypothetical protein
MHLNNLQLFSTLFYHILNIYLSIILKDKYFIIAFELPKIINDIFIFSNMH